MLVLILGKIQQAIMQQSFCKTEAFQLKINWIRIQTAVNQAQRFLQRYFREELEASAVTACLKSSSARESLQRGQ